MSEPECLEQMLQLADWMIDKISHRKDCQTACELLRVERMNMNLRMGL